MASSSMGGGVGVTMSHHIMPHPAPRSSRMQLKHPPPSKYAQYANLSGSETDVSTSTENLTQEERYLLRHMEREEPQGEENGDPMALLHSRGVGSFLSGASAAIGPVSDSQMLALMQLRHASSSRVATSRGLLDSPSGFTPTSYDSRSSLQDEIMAAKIAALTHGTPVGSGSGPSTPNSSSMSMNKLNPSVYSHPNNQDPLLANPKNYFPVLGGRKPAVEYTSSGAFFDPKAVNKGKPSDRPSSDIISQLTREMKRQQQLDPSSANAIFSESSDLSSHGGSNTQLHKVSHTTNPTSINNSNIIHTSISNSSNNQLVATRTTSASSSSGYKSDNSESKEPVIEHFQKRNNTRLGVNAPMGSNTSSTGSVASMLTRGKRAPDKLTILSRSQPDLYSSVENSELKQQQQELLLLQQEEQRLIQKHKQSRELARQKEESHESQGVLQGPINAPPTPAPPQGNGAVNYLKMIEALQNENRDLRGELTEMVKKVSKVSLLEQEVTKIHAAYQSLLKHSEKREALEKAARQKLQTVIINLSDVNKDLTERHEAIMGQLMSGDPKNQNIPGLDNILRGEIARKDALIAQLMGQNKMLITTKERQDIEVTAQQETLEEQRSHIQILDTALSNAQAQVLRLEEDNRVKEGYAERVKQMTRSLEQLQAASEKREAMEKKLRAKLEDELREYREAERLNERRFTNLGDQDVEDLNIKLSQAEEKIIRLESERTQWEQRYLEESAMRQVAIDAASIPKDARIAALEKNSAESEKFIAEARSEKLKQFEEMQNSQRRLADLENHIKTLEITIAEQSGLLRIAQSNQTLLESRNLLSSGRSATPTNQHLMAHQQQLSLPTLKSQSLSLHASPTHLLHARQLSHLTTPSASHAHSLANSPVASHGKQLSTPALGYSSAPITLSRPMVGVSHASSRTLAALIAQETGYGQHQQQQQQHELSRHLNATPTRSLLHQSEEQMLLKPTARHLPGLHLSTRDLLRSATPSAELMRSVTPLQVDINTGRRDSAPGDVLAHTFNIHSSVSPGSTRMNSSEVIHSEYHTLSRPISSLVVSVAASSAPNNHQNTPVYSSGMTVTGGGTMPGKISMAALRESAMNKSSSKYTGVHNPQPHHPQSPQTHAKSPRHRHQNSAPSSTPFPVPPPRQSQSHTHHQQQQRNHQQQQQQPHHHNHPVPPAPAPAPGFGGGSAHYQTGHSFIDDSIDSIMGPLTSTHIDSQSPNHSVRHDHQHHPHQPHHHALDGSNTYMEVWDI
ncbi:hypothetical protein TCAL_13347 [Tigriopus californicus]|uniref:Angiomotin C-terminal domain-containing protein n=2 Tax=Tigriopus californicus TaxID=6832 RepID=A0A553PD26_TIGCA|nr:hypothetical protein TCAL_13347 [Tigriopus californicus]